MGNNVVPIILQAHSYTIYSGQNIGKKVNIGSVREFSQSKEQEFE